MQEELYSSMEELFEEEERDSSYSSDTAFVPRHRHIATQVCKPSQSFHLSMHLLAPAGQHSPVMCSLTLLSE